MLGYRNAHKRLKLKGQEKGSREALEPFAVQ
jgi:hypothetical protein